MSFNPADIQKSENNLFSKLVCPQCGGTLSATVPAQNSNTEWGCSSCNTTYPIQKNVLRLVSKHYATNFAIEWHAHKRTQFDRPGMSLSLDRFFQITQWKPEDLNDKLVLDAGCGSGRFSEVALNCGARVVAVDLSEAVDAAMENLKSYKAFIPLQANITAQPFRDDTFDAVFSIGVLQHTPRPYRTLASLLRMCKPGGSIAVWFYSYKSPLQYISGMLCMKYFLRPMLKHLPPKRLYSLVQWYVPKLLPVSRFVRKITPACRIPIHEVLVPVANRDDIPGTTENDKVDLAILDTFDWFSPRYDKRLSETKVIKLLREYGYVNIVKTMQGGFTAQRTQHSSHLDRTNRTPFTA